MCILCEIKAVLDTHQIPNEPRLALESIFKGFMYQIDALVQAVGEHANEVPSEVYSAAEAVARRFESQYEADSETDRIDAAEYAHQFVEQLNASGIKAVLVNSPEALADALKNKDAGGNLEAWTPTGKAN